MSNFSCAEPNAQITKIYFQLLKEGLNGGGGGGYFSVVG